MSETGEDLNGTDAPSALFIVGGLLTVVGCFLPWTGHGDPLFILTPGIALYPSISIDPFRRIIPIQISDHGGLLLILISIIVILIEYSDLVRTHRAQLVLLLSSILVFLSIYHIAAVQVWSLSWLWKGFIFGRPQLMFGLPIVLVGSIMTLVASINSLQQPEKVG
jgi:hypothetical protein